MSLLNNALNKLGIQTTKYLKHRKSYHMKSARPRTLVKLRINELIRHANYLTPGRIPIAPRAIFCLFYFSYQRAKNIQGGRSYPNSLNASDFAIENGFT